MHPNRDKLIAHAEWIQKKASTHPRAEDLLQDISDGMRMMARESEPTPENLHGEIVLARGIVIMAKTLERLGDPVDSTLIAEMAKDVMLPR